MTEFRNPKQEQSAFRLRIVAAAVFVLVCFALLGLRLHHLQVAQFEYFHARAEGNRIAVLPVPPDRGRVYDRHGELLARNYAAYTVEIHPAQARKLTATIETLAQIVEISDADRRRFHRLLRERRYSESVPIRTHLDDDEVARIVARKHRMPGVDVRARLFRDYPLGESTAHVVGYIGRINERDVERIEERGDTANYRGSEYIGKSGLESSYEADLHGVTGIEQVEVNAAGRAVRSIARTPAKRGNDLELTLDAGLQRAAEAALGGRRGAVVAIEPQTGGILALVSTPSFDPNLFIDGISVADWRALSDSPDHPLLNRALYSAYPPGSTLKPFLALAGLERGERDVEERFHNQGVFTFAGQRYVDRKSRCQNNVDMHASIVHSCNTYYYQLAHDLGIDTISEFLRPFGFGQRSGVDVPGETSGVLPSREWKRTRFASREQQQWYGGETLSVGIGQGYNAYTPLQLANALAAMLNGGEIYRPHVVRHVVDAESGARRPVEPYPVARIPLSPTYVDAVTEAMIGVARVGTAARVFADAPYEAGGKTGTAQVFSLRGQRYVAEEVAERLRDHAWFIGFAPAHAPTVALAVLVENGGFGGQSAAPVARAVFDHYLLGEQIEEPAEEIDDPAVVEM